MIKLEEIAGYLPHGLKCHMSGEDIDKSKIFKIVGIEKTETGLWITARDEKEDMEVCLIEGLFPLFRPLTDLTREIEVNGEKFVPIYNLLGVDTPNEVEITFVEPKLKSLSRWEVYCFSPDGIKEWVESIPMNTSSWPYYRIKKLYEWHFWLGDQLRLLVKSLGEIRGFFMSKNI